MADSASRSAEKQPLKIPKEADMPDIEDVLKDAQREIPHAGLRDRRAGVKLLGQPWP
jgi:hypothetical protein